MNNQTIDIETIDTLDHGELTKVDKSIDKFISSREKLKNYLLNLARKGDPIAIEKLWNIYSFRYVYLRRKKEGKR
ncbi:MAG: hypothetical protein ACFFG0_05510 [Candidatus Thorarchaeota archaeon]